MLVDVIVFICTLILVAWLFHRIGKRSAQPDIYYKGRGEGWHACENLIIERMVKSKNMNLTEREILDEFIM